MRQTEPHYRPRREARGGLFLARTGSACGVLSLKASVRGPGCLPSGPGRWSGRAGRGGSQCYGRRDEGLQAAMAGAGRGGFRAMIRLRATATTNS
jgi:hypothetical protein